MNLKKMDEQFFSKYDLFISLHSKQIFPKQLVENHTCINIHPGYNPYNRGWYPHVFSMINKLPAGITIHMMDSELDHGSILFQRKIDIDEFDTSQDVYNKLQKLEIAMLEEYLPVILHGEYTEHRMCDEGNINYKEDFYNLCKMDLNKKASYGEVIDFLRAMTFNGFNNAYFIDKDGNKVYVSINLSVAQNSIR